MASAMYLRLLERAIERLRDPYRLSEREQAGIDAYLTPEEQVEIERRRVEIYQANEFMALPVDVWREYRFPPALEHAFSLFHLEHPGPVSRRESAEKRIAAKRARGAKNPTAYAEDAWKVNFHTEYSGRLVDSIRRAYEKLTADEALFWEHRGAWAPNNLPRHVESWENVFWPRHPNARRQAYIEVLTEKLDRAREA
ncbi:hypothetical protein [Sphingomonas baiyangensis]|uniref:Uncharacterized protein n=1 Tax=Sphingomonas baiyangensis TaxID=2572576 RepID=A0A4U1L2M1_9SPHN|nr:hypothetical protein [Sphingomonas baiyangensis]TKD50275.1 hypothetical protein FBR43_05515 [Sphingomonas baiyangensis]